MSFSGPLRATARTHTRFADVCTHRGPALGRSSGSQPGARRRTPRGAGDSRRTGTWRARSAAAVRSRQPGPRDARLRAGRGAVRGDGGGPAPRPARPSPSSTKWASAKAPAGSAPPRRSTRPGPPGTKIQPWPTRPRGHSPRGASRYLRGATGGAQPRREAAGTAPPPSRGTPRAHHLPACGRQPGSSSGSIRGPMAGPGRAALSSALRAGRPRSAPAATFRCAAGSARTSAGVRGPRRFPEVEGFASGSELLSQDGAAGPG